MLRALLILLGFVSLFLAVLGVLLPLLPTTPLVLVSAACFARSSRRVHGWLTGNKIFGPIIQNWEESRSIPKKAKAVSIIMLNISILVSGSFFLDKPIILMILGFTAISVSLFLYKIPTAK